MNFPLDSIITYQSVRPKNFATLHCAFMAITMIARVRDRSTGVAYAFTIRIVKNLHKVADRIYLGACMARSIGRNSSGGISASCPLKVDLIIQNTSLQLQRLLCEGFRDTNVQWCSGQVRLY